MSGAPTDLNGTSPDVADNSGGELGASPTWISATGQTWAWKTDGSINGASASGNASSAYLPFTPAAGKVYSLSATITTGANSTAASGVTNQWIGVGFTQRSTTSGTGNRWVDAATGANFPNPSPWLYHRGDHSATTGSNPDQTSLGQTSTTHTATEGYGLVNISDPVGSLDPNHPVDVIITLDTTTPLWNVSWQMRDSTVGGAYTTVRTLAYPDDNPTINFIGMTTSNTQALGSISNFKLESVPEPASTALLGMAGVMALARRRRERH